MAHRHSRNVSLTPELSSFIDAQLAGGDYGNASEVVRTALKLLRDRDAGASRVEGRATWLIGETETARLVRAHDWSDTGLGPAGAWSPALRATVSNVVNSPVPKVLMWGSDHVMIYNDGYRDIAGDKHPAALGATARGVWPEAWDWNRRVLAAGMAGEITAYRDQRITLFRDGRPDEAVFDLFYTPVYDGGESVGGVMGTVVENTERARAEAALAASEAELRTITDALPVLIAYVDRDHRYRFANALYEEWLGLDARAMAGRHAREVIGETLYASRLPLFARVLAGERVRAEVEMPHRDGRPRQCEVQYLPRFAADGAVDGFHVLVFDITDRIRHAAALERSNGRFHTAMHAVDGVLWTNTAEGRMAGPQPGWAALTGQAEAAYQGYGWAEAVHPDDVPATTAAWEAAVASRAPFLHEHRVRRHDGEWRTFAIRALPALNETGEIIEWVGVHTDITHRRAAETALREQAEDLARQVAHRERAEAQLRQLNETLEARVIAEIGERREAEARLAQAQKMETVGKLTGGVAHDFNNLLQVVSGNLQLLLKDVAGNAKAEHRVANAMAGVTRGAKLAAQLLAFGRRQALEPKVVDVTRFVRGMDDMLRRAIGEEIAIETVVANGLWNTFIDPAQIENALLNLAINARDAMQGKADGRGRLTIELNNAVLDEAQVRRHAQDEATPGQYVMLAVSDTGTGMTPDVLARVFEPFFSTKSEGKGSGLGLSMVYGFVRQSGGHVTIYSEPGEGTTIRLYLPRAMQDEDIEEVADRGPVTGGNETVLVVEDDDEVRATVVEMLGDLGYRVLKAVNADKALSVVESGMPIDLLFTDVVMPGALKSPELARIARSRLPGIAVLFTSGYTENSIVHGGRLDAGVELLSKPYTREALARKVRHVLGNQRQRTVAAHARDDAGSGTRPATPAPSELAAAVPRTVLLVEDDALIRTMAVELLEEAGHRVIAAGNAEEAATALRADRSIDVLVTDLNLPGASGTEVAAQARAAFPAIGVVFATGDVAGVDRRDTDAQLLAKPYSARGLCDAVARAGE